MPASIKIPAEFTAKDKFSTVVRKMGQGVAKFSRQSSTYIERFDQKITRSFKRLGTLGGLALGLSIGTIFTNAFNDVTTYETGLVGVGKTTKIAGNDLKKLGTDVIDLSDNMRGIKTENLLEVAQAAGQLGVTGSDNILRFSGTMTKMEKATDIAGEQGAASIARLLNITGEGVGVIDRFGSAIVGLGNSSAATESEILSVASEVGRSTAAYRLHAKEILGISTVLKSLDVRPEAAGTAVGQVFRGIEMATIKGGKSLRGFGKIMGMSTDQVTKTFQESPQKAFVTFIEGLNKISKEGGSVSKALLDVGLSNETISKGIIPLATNADLLNDKLAQSALEWEKNAALNEEFSDATKTVRTGLDDISKSWTNVILKQASAGSGLEKLQDALFWVSDNMETLIVVGASLVGMYVTLKAITWGVQAATAAYNVAIGINTALTQTNKKALIGNTVAQGAYRVAMAAGSAWTWIATAATTAFGVALNASIWPITLIVAAIAAVIAIIMNWDSITAWFSKQWGKFTNWISKAWDSVVNFFTEFDFKGFFMDIGNSLIKYFLKPLEWTFKLMAKAPGKLGEIGRMGLVGIEKMTADDSDPNNDKPLPSTNQVISENTQRKINETKVTMDIRDKGGNVESVSSNNNDIPINLGSTVGAI